MQKQGNARPTRDGRNRPRGLKRPRDCCRSDHEERFAIGIMTAVFDKCPAMLARKATGDFQDSDFSVRG
eukprot:6180908-Pleurochrysis_carterae.AAC.4